MNLRVLPEAEAEAFATALWYDRQRSGLGYEFLDELRAARDVIKEHAYSLPELETYSGSHDVRRLILKRFPYVVNFVCRDEEILVVAIAHERRRPLYWLDRLN